MSHASSWGVRSFMLLSAALSVVFIARSSVVVEGQRVFTLFDDAMISMRYGRHLAEGDGLVWNAVGSPVEGYTNLLWTVWMAGLHILPVPDRIIPLLVSLTGAVILVVVVWLSAQITSEITRSQLAPVLAAGLTATSYPLLFWTLRGMEVGLMCLLLSASVLIALRLSEPASPKQLWALGILLSLAILTRPDAAIAVAVLVAAVFVVARKHWKRLLLPLVGLPLAIALAHTGFRLAYYGEIVPNTYILKVSEIPLDNRLSRGVKAMMELLFGGAMLLPIVVAAAGVLDSIRSPGRQYRVLTPTALVAAFFAYSVYVGGDAWEDFGFANRYVSTVLPVLFALIAAGVAAMARGHRLIAAAVIFGAAATIILANVVLPPVDALFRVRDTSATLMIGMLLAAGAATVTLGFGRIVPFGRRMLGACSAIVVVGIVTAASASAFASWWSNNAQHEDHDSSAARYGLALSELTDPGARFAISSAGNIAYFAGNDRFFIDELGKMDPVIAAGAPRRVDFPPGHQKWDYKYTFDVLQPDLIAQAFGLTPIEADDLKTRGWIQIDEDGFVRPGARSVDIEGLMHFHRQFPDQ